MRESRGRVCVATVGCKVNRFESEALEEALREQGYEVVPPGEPADVVIVNSCTVTHRSDRDTRALVRRARQRSPGARIVVTGCYAEVAPEEALAAGADLVVGTGGKFALPELLREGATGIRKPSEIGGQRFPAVGGLRGRARAYLKVQDGCDAFCAYCIVPYARGRSRSLPLEEVRRGLARLREGGYGEVVLTGVHLGLWGRDLEPPQPLDALLDAAETAGIPRIRLSSLEPAEITDGLIERLAGSAVLCPHLHVPVQSGSDRVLQRMGRPYAAGRVRERISLATGRVPGLCVGMDLIVGFPGETEEDFRETLRLVEDLPVAYLHVFPFSPRRGTRAWDMPERVPAPEIKRRAAELRALGEEKRRAFWSSQVGRTLPALAERAPAEGRLRLRTRNYLPVEVEWDGSPPRGEVRVRIEGAGRAGLRGRVVSEAVVPGT